MKSIQTLSVGLLALIVAVICQTTPAHADNDKLDFTLVNSTGYPIKSVYVAPSASTEWGDDLLEKPLEDGQELAITFSPKAKAEHWDIRIEWTDDSPAVTWKDCKLSEINKITLHYDRAKDETSATTE